MNIFYRSMSQIQISINSLKINIDSTILLIFFFNIFILSYSLSSRPIVPILI